MSHELEREIQEAVGNAYRIRQRLARGGMSHVFLADDTAHARQVVIKVLDPELATSVNQERFRREIQVAVVLRHPHIVPVAAVGEARAHLFYIMPFVEGESLRSLLARERQLPIDQALGIARDVASALEYASGHNIVHRDIKPDNILIDRDGHALVTDFGIARAIERSADLASVTSTGLTLGTPTYMSPEQAAAESHVDGRSDIYSLACVTYEMLAGEPPFTGATAQAVIARHMQESPRPLRILRPELAPEVQRAIEWALAKAPADRPRSAAIFAAALAPPWVMGRGTPAGSVAARNVHGAGAGARTPGSVRTRRLPRRWLLAALAGAVAVGIASRFLPLGDAGQPRAEERAVPTRIAVTEFEDHSEGGALQHIASGLTVSLVHELAAVPALQVVSRNQLRTLRERGSSLDSIVSQLHIGSLVEGSVQQSNGRLRVFVQLVDPSTHSPLESATIERQIGEVFRLEDDVTHQVASLLRRRIGAEVRVRGSITSTRNARARDLSFRANSEREHALRVTASPEASDLAEGVTRLERADSLLEEAQRADPQWQELALDRGRIALDLALRQAGEPQRQSFERAVSFAERALATAPHTPAALELRGTTRYWEAARLPLADSLFRDRIGRAEADLSEAIALDSSRAAALGTLSLVQVASGAIPAAARTARLALAADSFLDDAATIHQALIDAYLVGGDYDAVALWCARAHADFPARAAFVQCDLTRLAEDPSIAPDRARARRLAAICDSLEPAERARKQGRDYVPLYRQLMVAAVLARAGDRDAARRIALELRRQAAPSAELTADLAYDEAYLRLLLGERAESLRLLAQYLRTRQSMRVLVARHARWRALRGDPAFEALVRPPA
ncbi:MAG: protein kinase [Gemmatimonadaceae bacterium]|nr:protein kinase [Gemmatimonadaceae bacterium]